MIITYYLCQKSYSKNMFFYRFKLRKLLLLQETSLCGGKDVGRGEIFSSFLFPMRLLSHITSSRILCLSPGQHTVFRTIFLHSPFHRKCTGKISIPQESWWNQRCWKPKTCIVPRDQSGMVFSVIYSTSCMYTHFLKQKKIIWKN